MGSLAIVVRIPFASRNAAVVIVAEGFRRYVLGPAVRRAVRECGYGGGGLRGCYWLGDGVRCGRSRLHAVR